MTCLVVLAPRQAIACQQIRDGSGLTYSLVVWPILGESGNRGEANGKSRAAERNSPQGPIFPSHPCGRFHGLHLSQLWRAILRPNLVGPQKPVPSVDGGRWVICIGDVVHDHGLTAEAVPMR